MTSEKISSAHFGRNINRRMSSANPAEFASESRVNNMPSKAPLDAEPILRYVVSVLVYIHTCVYKI